MVGSRKTIFVLGRPIFGGYVSVRECTFHQKKWEALQKKRFVHCISYIPGSPVEQGMSFRMIPVQDSLLPTYGQSLDLDFLGYCILCIYRWNPSWNPSWNPTTCGENGLFGEPFAGLIFQGIILCTETMILTGRVVEVNWQDKVDGDPILDKLNGCSIMDRV